MLKYLVIFLLVFQARADQYGVVLAGSTHVFWKAVLKGIYSVQKEKVGVEIIDRSPMDDNEIVSEEQSQLKMISFFQKLKIKGLILAPIPLKGNKGKYNTNVPTVFVDRDSADFSPPITVVETNNFLAGKLAAQEVSKRLKKGASFAIFGLSNSVISTSDREKGFKDEALRLGMKFHSHSYLGHGFREAEARALILLNGVKNLDVIFTPNESTTRGVMLALNTLPKNNIPKLVGFDFRHEFGDAMKKDVLTVLIVQDPFAMGKTALEKLIEHNSGLKVNKSISIPPFVVTKENIDSQQIQNKLQQFY